jgi:hypothetical protein
VNDGWGWKIAILAIGIIIGMLEGQFQPNRNIVTVDQLNSANAATAVQIEDINKKLDDVKTSVDYLKGRAEGSRP